MRMLSDYIPTTALTFILERACVDIFGAAGAGGATEECIADIFGSVVARTDNVTYVTPHTGRNLAPRVMF